MVAQRSYLDVRLARPHVRHLRRRHLERGDAERGVVEAQGPGVCEPGASVAEQVLRADRVGGARRGLERSFGHLRQCGQLGSARARARAQRVGVAPSHECDGNGRRHRRVRVDSRARAVGAGVYQCAGGRDAPDARPCGAGVDVATVARRGDGNSRGDLRGGCGRKHVYECV